MKKTLEERDRDIDILARTLWGEARGEGAAGMQAVASVVLNRARRGGWWGAGVAEVCLKPRQFSCWNEDDPNREKVAGATPPPCPRFAVARRIACRAVCGVMEDLTGGATHYHAAGAQPYWAEGRTPCAVIGRHVFYRIVNNR